MARRGKTANRNARRRAQRNAAQRQPAAGSDAPAPAVDAAPATGAMPDAFEIADAEVRAAAQPPLASAAGVARAKPRATDPRITVGSSRLGERAVAEYHYVQRDLRNIGVLAIILAALLAAATILVNVTGLI
ncbi:MAG TPA: hypothetical protein VIC83_05525 [Candidatus Limnocylindria bacterium]|jgi:hypothetical protein